MGSYAEFTIDGHSIGSWKAPFHEAGYAFFSTQHVVRDKKIVRDEYDGEIEESEEDFIALVIPADKLRQRMDILGFTLGVAEEVVLHALKSQWEFAASDDYGAPEVLPDLEPIYHQTLEAAVSLFEEGAPAREWDRIERLIVEKANLPNELRHHVEMALEDTGFGVIARLVVNRLAGEIHLDLTDIVQGGWLGEEQVDQLLQDTDTQFLVVTEGSSDRKIIERALQHLHPELADLFYFADEKLPLPQSGAARVTELLKAFASIKVRNNTIAIFDNDSEGRHEYSVSKLACKDAANIEPILLPDREDLTSVVCSGPDGLHVTDINGRAASIEMYLDRLPLERGEAEVKWNAFLAKAGDWQGEPIKKKQITRSFFQHLKTDTYETSGLEAVLETIFNAASTISQRAVRAELIAD